jgi:3-phenylpropionate/trans-cinnamate dioxygenase ferredoxin reductase component
MKNGVVIVGAGHGGVQAAASLREEGFDGPITLVGDEAELPYHKPPLSKTFIKDPAAQPQMLRADIFYRNNRIDLRLGSFVERIDLAGKRLELGDGSHIPFDAAILATGSRPRELRLAGSELAGVLSLRSVADARSIRDLSARVEDVVILGGGFIGLEIAATLTLGGRRVTVVEAQDRLLGRAVAPSISAHVRQRLEAMGIRILTQTTIERLEGENGHLSGALTSRGERLPAQMAIIGIGVVPNVELAQAAGLKLANGIWVDGQLRSSQPEIFAIGDVASYRHVFSNSDVRLESVQNATDHAKLTARIITGHEGHYDSVPWFWSDIGDMKLQMVGLASASDSNVVVGDVADNKFSVYHYSGSRLIAIESVNRPADHMLGRKMLGAGFSPKPEIVQAGADALKAAFAEAQKVAAA